MSGLTEADLVSPKYKRELQRMHATQKWGADGGKHLVGIMKFAADSKSRTVLDYGCGRGVLKQMLKAPGLTRQWHVEVLEYDPGVPGKDRLPKPVDLVVCTDVLEHVEPEKLHIVVGHIYALARRAAYFVISTRLANAVLPSGQNAHLIVREADWWRDAIALQGFDMYEELISRHEAIFRVLKPGIRREQPIAGEGIGPDAERRGP